MVVCYIVFIIIVTLKSELIMCSDLQIWERKGRLVLAYQTDDKEQISSQICLDHFFFHNQLFI